jgi:hypothetical protein
MAFLFRITKAGYKKIVAAAERKTDTKTTPSRSKGRPDQAYNLNRKTNAYSPQATKP